MSGLIYSHPACLEHDPGALSPGHPDTPLRLATLERALDEHGWLGWERRSAPAASEEQLELAHSAGLVRAIRELCAAGGGAIDPDTFAIEASFGAAVHAAGAAVAMSADLLAGEAQAGFCAVRPAGHHAERARAMGFCLFNNVAVAAACALAELGLSRVFVLDWDVHHGNGTAEIFDARNDVLFASIHQWPLYPGSGRLQDRGRGEGEGYTINLPVPPGSGEALWLGLLEQVVVPVAAAYEPQLILISAGFDAHERDPLADCRLGTGSFVQMAVRVRDLARRLGVGVGMVLEGGYNVPVLAECVLATLPALLDEQERLAPSPPGPAEQEILTRAAAQVGRWWPA
jgi:acetoin utilization deacetylase AcuC-like enzyme